MIVYVEYVLLDNFIIDFIIFYSVAKILKLKIQKVRIVLACVLGVGFAFAIPFINITNIILFLIKLLMGVILVYVAFSFTKLKQFFLTYLSFIFLTFLLGGICYGLQGFVQSTKVINGTISYVNDFPVSLIIVAKLFVCRARSVRLHFQPDGDRKGCHSRKSVQKIAPIARKHIHYKSQ